MTAKQRAAAAIALSGAVMVTFAVGYLLFRPYPLAMAAMVIAAPWWVLRLTRRLQHLSPEQFCWRGLLFGFCGTLGAMGVLLPYGPPLERLGLHRAAVATQVAFVFIYFVLGACGAFLGAWVASHITIAGQRPTKL